MGMAVIAQSCEILPKKVALVREILERIADKWTLLVIDALMGSVSCVFPGFSSASAVSATRC
jgi:hypothetical protein